MKKFDYTAELAVQTMKEPIRDQDTFMNEIGMRDIEFSNAGGFGFWCGDSCVKKKLAAGKAPWFGKAKKAFYADKDLKAAKDAAKDDGSTKQILDTLKTATPPPVGVAAPKDSGKKDNTMLYAGIGGGLLLLIGIGYVVMKKKK